jgi:hypoxanthine phosphoribosyltransferase
MKIEIPGYYRLRFSESEIQHRIGEIAREIDAWFRTYADGELPVLLCVLRGGIHFFSDLHRALITSTEPAFCRAHSYDTGSNVQLGDSVRIDLQGFNPKDRSILVVDDICDSGRTLVALTQELKKGGAHEVRSAVLILRELDQPIFKPDWIGFATGERSWFAGYGMADREFGANLRDVYAIN